MCTLLRCLPFTYKYPNYTPRLRLLHHLHCTRLFLPSFLIAVFGFNSRNDNAPLRQTNISLSCCRCYLRSCTGECPFGISCYIACLLVSLLDRGTVLEGSVVFLRKCEFDGVLRHFNELGAVLNYEPLSPQQISQSFSDTSSLDAAEKKEHLSQVFENMDGRNVNGSALLNPPANIYPTSFLSNQKPSEASEVPRSDLGLNPRQHCAHHHCFPGESCTKYPGCSRCFIKDMSCKEIFLEEFGEGQN